MELGIISDEVSLDLEEAFTEGKALGFNKYEIRCFDDFEYRVPYFKPGRVERLYEKVASKEIEVTALTPGTFKIELGETEKLKVEMEETLPQTCELAVRLGAPKIIVFGFMRGGGGTMEAAIEQLKRAAQIVHSYNLELSIENEPGSFLDTGVNTAEAMQALAGKGIGVNWDPANAITSGEAAYPVGYDAVKPYINNIHIKDSFPLPGGKWENRLIGDGGMNWIGQFKALLKDKPVPFMTLETHVFPVLEATREDLRRYRIFLDAIRAIETGA
ncbi:MAG: sugar phosphate isomerase/epimerase [Opitutales bacterium]|nr:sugar phosphate isomerase/epimerase [Opitutales bacterium]